MLKQYLENGYIEKKSYTCPTPHPIVKRYCTVWFLCVRDLPLDQSN